MYLYRSAIILLLGMQAAVCADTPLVRPPAVPLVVHDPFFSIWSCADHLTDDVTRHWTKRSHSLTSLILVDGKPHRLMGAGLAPAMKQISVRVYPTRTVYEFGSPEVRVKLTFLTPALPNELEVLSRPLTYLIWEVAAADGKQHTVTIYFSASAEIAVDNPEQRVVWARQDADNLAALRIGSEDQAVLQSKGDDHRIDWGYLYVAAAKDSSTSAVGLTADCLKSFVAKGDLSQVGEPTMPRAVKDGMPAAAFVLDMGKVGAEAVVRHVMLAYDDEFAINYAGRRLRGFWRKDGVTAGDLLRSAARDYSALRIRCERFDDELLADLTKVGGKDYAQMCSLAYRQCWAGNKLAADSKGQPLLFPKENTSNGCIATVDVIYPMDPMFMLFGSTLAKASLVPVLNYALSERWKLSFAPHDLGTYPIATGQVYGGESVQGNEGDRMPVEECGNMLILLAAIARMDGNAEFAGAYWPAVTRWARYLEAKGFDPENQLCTDDFAGHLAHNTNLSVKAILGIGSYGLLCELRGDGPSAGKYLKLARELADKWPKAADDRDHYRLAFDRPGTWSQKYNLVWDRLLGLNLFAPDVARREVAYYRKMTNRYGVPLDSRKAFTKTDWTLWVATLAKKPDDFQAIITPIMAFLNETKDRVPFSDFYWTQDAKDAGMHARPVIGGVFIKALADGEIWKKWAGRERLHGKDWAPFPRPPRVNEVVATARRAPVTWHYTTQKPAADWYKSDFSPKGWRTGPAGFGTAFTPGSVVRTVWNSADIWTRREFMLPDAPSANLQFLVHHDEDVTIYLNGVLAARATGYTTDYELLRIRPAAQATLKPGKNVIAVHCHQTTGGQYIDAGIVEVTEN
jgi:hypothetical protein